MKFFEIFRAGKYPQGTFSKEDIELLAKNYDPTFCEAPITLDHEQSGPAYGWIEKLIAENGVLKALFRDVSGELKELVLTGKYKKISVEIYKDLEGKGPYLKAVTFLGAAIPQVKGMEPVEFREGESEKYIFETEDTKPANTEDFISRQEIVTLQNHISEMESRVAHLIDQPNGDKQLIATLQEKMQALSAQMKMLEKSEDARQKTEQELNGLKQKIRNEEFENFLHKQMDAGILNATQKELGLKILTALDNVKQFDESDYVDEFKKFIETIRKREMTQDFATEKRLSSQEDEFLDFANASEESLSVYKEAKQLAKKENIPFKDALLKLYK